MSEFIIIPISLIIVSLMVFMASTLSTSFSNDKFETLTPNLDYEFPKTVVIAFLNYPINSTDSVEIFGDDLNYVVSDLLWVSTDESLEMVENYREIFLEDKNLNIESQLKLFQEFGQRKSYGVNDLIHFDFDASNVFDLQKERTEFASFYFVVPSKSGGFHVVYYANNEVIKKFSDKKYL